MTAQIIPINPKTGQPRKGKWLGRYWIPATRPPFAFGKPSNPNFVWGEYGRAWWGKEEKL